jgi:hypothetical protein
MKLAFQSLLGLPKRGRLIKLTRAFHFKSTNNKTQAFSNRLKHPGLHCVPGADMLFIESPETPEVIKTIGARFHLPFWSTLSKVGGRAHDSLEQYFPIQV